MWASIYEEKWGRVPIKLEWKLTVHREGRLGSLHKPRLTYGGEGKIVKKGWVVKGIEHQR